MESYTRYQSATAILSAGTMPCTKYCRGRQTGYESSIFVVSVYIDRNSAYLPQIWIGRQGLFFPKPKNVRLLIRHDGLFWPKYACARIGDAVLSVLYQSYTFGSYDRLELGSILFRSI